MEKENDNIVLFEPIVSAPKEEVVVEERFEETTPKKRTRLTVDDILKEATSIDTFEERISYEKNLQEVDLNLYDFYLDADGNLTAEDSSTKIQFDKPGARRFLKTIKTNHNYLEYLTEDTMTSLINEKMHLSKGTIYKLGFNKKGKAMFALPKDSEFLPYTELLAGIDRPTRILGNPECDDEVNFQYLSDSSKFSVDNDELSVGYNFIVDSTLIKKLYMEYFLFRPICSNGLISKENASKNEVSKDFDIPFIASLLSTYKNQSGLKVDFWTKSITNMKNSKIKNLTETFGELRETLGNAVVDSAEKYIINKNPILNQYGIASSLENAWDVVNVITFASHQIKTDAARRKVQSDVFSWANRQIAA